MDITLNEDQALIHRTALEFAQEAAPAARVREWESSEHGFDPSVWQRMIEMGWAGAVFPAEYGGSGFTMLELSLIFEALGQASLPSPLFSSVVESGLLLLEAGNAEQRAHWLPRIASGESLLTVALQEPGGGLQPADMRTRLSGVGGSYQIDGTKLFVRDAGVADTIVCVARFGEAADDLALVVVPAGSPGVSRTRLKTAGGEALWEVRFDQVAVDPSQFVGTLGAVAQPVRQLIQRGAAMKAAELTGVGQFALDLTLDYARTRVQFGRPIGSFQGVQHHCAEMLRDLTVTRLLSRQAAARLASGRPALREVSMAKAKASEAIPALTRTAHQIHGAVGYYRDYPLELGYHRALAAAASYGTAPFHRKALAGLMREDMAAFRGDHA